MLIANIYSTFLFARYCAKCFYMHDYRYKPHSFGVLLQQAALKQLEIPKIMLPGLYGMQLGIVC